MAYQIDIVACAAQMQEALAKLMDDPRPAFPIRMVNLHASGALTGMELRLNAAGETIETPLPGATDAELAFPVRVFLVGANDRVATFVVTEEARTTH